MAHAAKDAILGRCREDGEMIDVVAQTDECGERILMAVRAAGNQADPKAMAAANCEAPQFRRDLDPLYIERKINRIRRPLSVKLQSRVMGYPLFSSG